jgi:hypothetical protein
MSGSQVDVDVWYGVSDSADTPELEADDEATRTAGVSSAGDGGKSRGAASAPLATTAKLAARRRATFLDVDDMVSSLAV